MILGKACDLIDQHQQSMSASSPAKQRSQEKEAAQEAAEADDETSSEEEEESGIEESGKPEDLEAEFPVGSKVEDIVLAARASSDLSRDVVQLCHDSHEIAQHNSTYKLYWSTRFKLRTVIPYATLFLAFLHSSKIRRS